MAEIQMKGDKFYIHMFEKDYDRIRRWVLQFPDLETGGTLFGLWKNKHNLVAHFVLGPGTCCKRTNVSFFQDISYLERVGNFLTHDYMICHIGEWHSHHKLRLYKPSSGDENTVVRNYPHGTCSFVLIIANIVSSNAVALSPYLFTEETCTRRYGARYDTGEIVFIPSESPFRNLEALKLKVSDGEEKYSYTRSDDGASERPREGDVRLKKYEPTSYGKSTKQESMKEREARQGFDSESNRRNDLQNKKENSPLQLQEEKILVSETDKQSKAATNLNSSTSVELSALQSANLDFRGGSNWTATTTTGQNTASSTSALSSISTSVIGNYGRESSSGLGNITHQNKQTNNCKVVTLQPQKLDTINQLANYPLTGRSQPLTTPISNAAYGGATITTNTTAEHWSNPSSATKEPVLQQAGLDPPRVSNYGQYTTNALTGTYTYSKGPFRAQVPYAMQSQLPCGSGSLTNTYSGTVVSGQYTTKPLTGAYTYSNEPFRAQVPHDWPSQLSCGSGSLTDTYSSTVVSGQNTTNLCTSVSNFSNMPSTNLRHVVHSTPSQPTCGSDPLRSTYPNTMEQFDQLYINPGQWYSTSSGQNDLKQVLRLLSTVADGDVQMSRNQITHNLQMKFSHHGTKWVVECPSGFPKQGAKLSKEQFDILKKTYCEINVKDVLKTEIEEIVNELEKEVKRHCNKCSMQRNTDNYHKFV